MRKLFLVISILSFSWFYCQKDYSFDYFSVYENGSLTTGKPLDSTYIYDNSEDTSYQLFVYDKEAKLMDEEYNEIHYFKRDTLSDSPKFDYDYSLKVFFQPDMKISSVQVKQINGIDYEISYIKEVDRKKSKHVLEICIQESETDLLNTGYMDLSKKETSVVFTQLRKWIDPEKNYFAKTVFLNNGRYRFIYDRVKVEKQDLLLTVPKEKYYKNSFLKK